MTADLFTTSTAEISQCDAGNEPGHDRAACPVCEVYRYELRRVWGDPTRLVCWVMLNPSTADADLDDPTIRRCTSFTRAWGYGGFIVVNLFALRATDPSHLVRHPDPAGALNDQFLLTAAQTPLVMAAWGAEPFAHARGATVTAALTAAGVPLSCLGTNRDGSPKHPLYIRSATRPVPYREGVVTW